MNATRRMQFVRFVVAAGLSVPVNVGTRILLSRVMPFEAAVALAHVAGMLTAWALTRLFVFAPSGRTAASELGRFALVNLWSLVQTWVVSVALVRWVFPALDMRTQPELIAHLAGLLLTAVTSYWAHRRWSFARS